MSSDNPDKILSTELSCEATWLMLACQHDASMQTLQRLESISGKDARVGGATLHYAVNCSRELCVSAPVVALLRLLVVRDGGLCGTVARRAWSLPALHAACHT